MSHHPFRYTVNGLALACNVPLKQPGLRRDGGHTARPPDVLVHWGGPTGPSGSPLPIGEHRIVEATGGWLDVSPCLGPDGDKTSLRFGYADQHVRFDISPRADRVVVTWTAAVLPVHACTLLFTTVLGYLLHRHGRLALHAGVVARHEHAFVFAGVQGAGKSTILRALVASGCATVSDDVAALTRQADGWAVHLGLAGIRLSPQVRSVLGIPADGGTPVWPRSPHMADTQYAVVEDKAVVVSDSPAGREPLPLGGIFLLPPRRRELVAPRIDLLPAAAAIPHLAAQVLTPAWLKQSVTAERFASLADLVASTPVRVVERPDSLAALPDVCDALVNEMARLPG